MQGQHVDSFSYRSCVFLEPWCLAAIDVYHGNAFCHHALPNMTTDTATEADAAMETHLQECPNHCYAALGWLHLWIPLLSLIALLFVTCNISLLARSILCGISGFRGGANNFKHARLPFESIIILMLFIGWMLHSNITIMDMSYLGGLPSFHSRININWRSHVQMVSSFPFVTNVPLGAGYMFSHATALIPSDCVRHLVSMLRISPRGTKRTYSRKYKRTHHYFLKMKALARKRQAWQDPAVKPWSRFFSSSSAAEQPHSSQDNSNNCNTEKCHTGNKQKEVHGKVCVDKHQDGDTTDADNRHNTKDHKRDNKNNYAGAAGRETGSGFPFTEETSNGEHTDGDNSGGYDNDWGQNSLSTATTNNHQGMILASHCQKRVCHCQFSFRRRYSDSGSTHTLGSGQSIHDSMPSFHTHRTFATHCTFATFAMTTNSTGKDSSSSVTNDDHSIPPQPPIPCVVCLHESQSDSEDSTTLFHESRCYFEDNTPNQYHHDNAVYTTLNPCVAGFLTYDQGGRRDDKEEEDINSKGEINQGGEEENPPNGKGGVNSGDNCNPDNNNEENGNDSGDNGNGRESGNNNNGENGGNSNNPPSETGGDPGGDDGDGDDENNDDENNEGADNNDDDDDSNNPPSGTNGNPGDDDGDDDDSDDDDDDENSGAGSSHDDDDSDDDYTPGEDDEDYLDEELETGNEDDQPKGQKPRVRRNAKSVQRKIKSTSSTPGGLQANDVLHRLNEAVQMFAVTSKAQFAINYIFETLHKDFQGQQNGRESLQFLTELLMANTGTARNPQLLNEPNIITTPSKQDTVKQQVGGSRMDVLFERLLLCIISGSIPYVDASFKHLLEMDEQKVEAANAGGIITGDLNTVKSLVQSNVTSTTTATPQVRDVPVRKRLPPVRDLPVRKSLDALYHIAHSVGDDAPCEGLPDTPIYGELKKQSMQSVINLMKKSTNFTTDSIFLDIGSGMGKPNFHAAQDPGVALSIGYEISESRRNSSILCKHHLAEQAITSNCYFANVDVASLANLNGFTHVYTFDTG